MRNFSKFTGILLSAALASYAGAQAFDMYYDGFENRPTNQRPEDYGTEPGYPWLNVRESVGGVTPYSGKKMLELRSDPRKERGILTGNLNIGLFTRPFATKSKPTKCSMRLYLVEPEIEKEIYGGTFVIHSDDTAFRINTKSGKWSFLGVTGTTPIPFNRWFELSVQQDWSNPNSGSVFSIDGHVLARTTLFGGITAPYVDAWRIGVGNLVDRTDTYAFPDNPAPGLLIDDYRVTSVPEPMTFLVLGGGVFMSNVIRRRSSRRMHT